MDDSTVNIIEKIIEIKKNKERKRPSSFFQMIRDIFYSKKNEYRVIKTAFCFPIGILFSVGLYFSVIDYLELEQFVKYTLSLILGICISLGYSLSVQIRCMCWLVLPTFFGKSGRAYLATLAITHVINGPFDNVIYNTNESVRVIGCITNLAFNHSIERSRLMFRPIKFVAAEFSNGSDILQEEIKNLTDTFIPIEEEVENKQDMPNMAKQVNEVDKEIKSESRISKINKRYAKEDKSGPGKEKELDYKKKLEYRCEVIFSQAVHSCRITHADMYKKCLGKLFLVGFLVCWPFLLQNACNLLEAKGGSDSCMSRKNVNKGFGESYETLNLVDKEMQENFRVNLQYKLNVPEEKVDQITPEDITESLTNHFESRRRLANLLIVIFKRILAFMFLYVFIKAKSYNEKYLKDIKFDNIYITKYFRKIDKRRKKLGKFSLLPIKKAEKNVLISATSLKFSKDEKKQFMIGTLLLICQILSVSIIIGFDQVFYELLLILRRSSQIEFRQRGVHHIHLNITGNGFVANIIRSIVKSFRVEYSLDKITTTVDCLPNPRILDQHYIKSIFIIYGIIWFFILTQAYGLRFRNYICSIFYPKRQKKRIIYLYNQQLKKRRSYLRQTRHQIRRKLRDEGFMQDRSVLQIIIQDYPRYFGWMKFLRLGLRNCVICEEKETSDHYICPNFCGLCYCRDCWKDVGEHCYGCSPLEESLSELSSDEF